MSNVKEGYLYLKRNNGEVSKKYFVLDGSDLYCYNRRGEEHKLIFMHSLVSSFIED